MHDKEQTQRNGMTEEGQSRPATDGAQAEGTGNVIDIVPRLGAQAALSGAGDLRTYPGPFSETDIVRIAREIKRRKAAEGAKVRVDTLAAQRMTAHLRAIGTNADAVTWLNGFSDASVDLLFTDPPYSTYIEPIEAFVDSWLLSALSKVKDTGSAYIFIGAYPREIAAYLNVLLGQTAFTVQTLVWSYKNTLGPAPSHSYKNNYQMVLFLRGKNAPRLQPANLLEQFSSQEMRAPDGRLKDRFHSWQKPYKIADMFVRHSTTQGDIVIDPFMCTGTFILAAADLGRIGLGCDNDDEVLKTAEERGCIIV